MKSLLELPASVMAVAHNTVFIALLFLNASCFVYSKSKKCETIRIPMCQNIGYNMTYMPNMFNHDTQEEAALEVHQFWPLVEIKCSPDLKYFLCSMYAPMCQPNFRDEIPPCRSICKRARKGCAPLMRQYGFSWPKRMRCKNFPMLGGEKLCMGRNATETNRRPTTSGLPHHQTTSPPKVNAAWQENQHVNCSCRTPFVSVMDGKFKPHVRNSTTATETNRRSTTSRPPYHQTTSPSKVNAARHINSWQTSTAGNHVGIVLVIKITLVFYSCQLFLQLF